MSHVSNARPSQSADKVQIELIDLARAFQGSPDAKLEAARQIRKAAESVGFFVVTGHGVPTDVIERMEAASRAFFDLPEEVKLQAVPASKIYRGYIALGGLSGYKGAPDYREMYTASKMEVDRSDPYYQTDAARRIFAPNVWPESEAGFEAAWTAYYKQMEAFGRRLLRLCALGLDLDETWFDDKIDRHMSTMSATNYPDQVEPPQEKQYRCGAHTDFGLLTLLRAEDKPGGLEVLTSDDRWLRVPIAQNSYIINVGDTLTRWTNDRWISAVHRVANPERDEAIGSRRQSIIYFMHPNYDANIECIPSCLDHGQAKHSPIVAHEWIYAKINRMRGTENATDGQK